MSLKRIEAIRERMAPVRQRLSAHPLYRRMSSLEDVRHFMEHHVFAVWDFMSLLKRLQRDLTCVGVPWVPMGDPSLRQLINEIVRGEESDVDCAGRATSHFELYLAAMEEAGAEVGTVSTVVDAVRRGVAPRDAMVAARVPGPVLEFSTTTFDLALTGGVHEVAAAFTFGREDLIPDLFHGLIDRLGREHPGRLETFRYYLQRHIDVDGGEHAGLALKMVEGACGQDAGLWGAAAEAAHAAIEARARFWDAIHSSLVARG